MAHGEAARAIGLDEVVGEFQNAVLQVFEVHSRPLYLVEMAAHR